jgi:DNA-binding NarL/FixJ family response regulator
MKVLLIDDHPLILTALQKVIEGIGTHVSVVGANSAKAGARGARRRRRGVRPDAARPAPRRRRRLRPADRAAQRVAAVPVVVVSASDRSADVIRSIDLGAMGFVPKRASNETLQEALHVVMQGGIYVPQMTMSGEGDMPPAGDPASFAATHSAAAMAAFKLTPRQTDVLALLLRGLSNKLIARELNLSVETVKDHVAAVLRALGVNSRTQAVLAVSQMPGQGGIAPWPPRPST